MVKRIANLAFTTTTRTATPSKALSTMVRMRLPAGSSPVSPVGMTAATGVAKTRPRMLRPLPLFLLLQADPRTSNATASVSTSGPSTRPLSL